MPYEHLEEFLDRGEEKFLGPLSIANLAGALVGGAAGYQAPVWLGLPLPIVATTTLLLALAGIAATWRVSGMTLLSRTAWALRFWLRLTLDPASAHIGHPPVAPHPALARGPLLLRRNGRVAAVSRAARPAQQANGSDNATGQGQQAPAGGQP